LDKAGIAGRLGAEKGQAQSGVSSGSQGVQALKGVAALSNGSACTSSSYTPSHVLLAMGLSEDESQETFRLSWCHLTPPIEGDAIRSAVMALR